MLWVALYGSRQQLWILTAAVLVLFVAPVLTIGEPDFGPAGAGARSRRLALLTVLFGGAVQEVVGRFRVAAVAERRGSQFLTSLLEAATEHVIVATDLTGKVVFFSDGAERILGRPSYEVLGRNLVDVAFDADEVADRARALGGVTPLEAVVAAAGPEWSSSDVWTFSRGPSGRPTDDARDDDPRCTVRTARRAAG